MKKILGTETVSGLNVGESSRTMDASQLQASLNGWTDKTGVWTTCQIPDPIAYGYADILAFASGRVSGTTHNVWVDGNDIYDDQSTNPLMKVTPAGWGGTFGTEVHITPVYGGFLILGGDRNYFYNGNIVLEWGTWQAERMQSSMYVTPCPQGTITGISNASSAVVDMAADIANVGDLMYIDAASDMVEINSKAYEITGKTGAGPYSYTLDVNSTTYTPWTAGGIAHGQSSGIVGDYKYYVVPIVKDLSTNIVTEGKPRGLSASGSILVEKDDSWEAEALTIAITDRVESDHVVWRTQSAGGASIWYSSGALGVDYDIGLRQYRTKAGGVEIYMEREWWSGDADVTVTSDTFTTNAYRIGTKDSGLGAVYTGSTTSNSNPELARLAVPVGQRIFYVETDDDFLLHWTGTDNVNNTEPLDSVVINDSITALGQQRGRCVVFSVGRMWWFSLDGGLPRLVEIDTEVGTDWPSAIDTSAAGLLFLREDGLWVYDGVTTRNMSRQAFDFIDTPTSVCADGDTLYMAGLYDSYIMRTTNNANTWHNLDYGVRYADSTAGKFYGASTTTVSELFAGPKGSAELVSKEFGGWDEWAGSVRLTLDVTGDTTPTVYVNGNKTPADTNYLGNNITLQPNQDLWPGSLRRLVRYSMAPKSAQFMTIGLKVSGNTDIHGYMFEAVR